MSSPVRHGTRISCSIPITLTSRDPTRPFSEPGLTIFANPQGCGIRCSRPLEIGTPVEVEGLLTKSRVTAQVVNSIPLGEYEKFWLIGLALDEPGNVWGIEKPPEDWLSLTNKVKPDSVLRMKKIKPDVPIILFSARFQTNHSRRLSSNSINQGLWAFDPVNEFIFLFLFWSFGNRSVGDRYDTAFRTQLAELLHQLRPP